MLKPQKKELVEKLASRLEGVGSVLLVNYTGLNVASQQELKHKLDEVGAKMTVVKNTLLKRAFEIAKLPSELSQDEMLNGQTALVVSGGDSVAPIQILGKFAKENSIPKFKVGVVEGKVTDEAGLTTISTLPSKEVLLAQVLGSLVSPMYGLTGTLEGNLQKLIYILSQKANGGE